MKTSTLYRKLTGWAFAAVMVGLSAASAFAAPNLTVGSASGQAGTNVNVPVTFDPTTNSVGGIQFTIALPTGVSTGPITLGTVLNNAGKSVSSNVSGSNWIIIVFGLNQNTISAGTLFTAQMSIAAGTTTGSKPLTVSNVVYSDPNGQSVTPGTSTSGSINVLPAAPVISSAGTATGTVGVAFSYQIVATNSPTSFNATGLPAGLTINTTNGLISGTPTTAGTSNITLSATNAGGTGTRALTLTVNPPAPVITSTGVVTGTVGVAFTYQIVGTNSPTSYNATGLPAGLSINTASGFISGTPSVTGTSNITLSATNAGGTGTKNLVLTVTNATPVITSTGAASGTTGVAFSYQIVATNSPTSYNATGLPAGLSINTASGLISGTPSVVGTSNITLSATNAGGTGTKTLILTVNPPAPVVTSANTATGRTGSAFNYQITATNNPTSFNATGLLAGLSVNTANGLISGVPTAAGTATVTLSATNAGGTGTMSMTLTVFSACDVNSDTSTNVSDVQIEVLQAIFLASCTNDINQDGACNVIDVQRVVNAALGGACVAP